MRSYTATLDEFPTFSVQALIDFMHFSLKQIIINDTHKFEWGRKSSMYSIKISIQIITVLGQHISLNHFYLNSNSHVIQCNTFWSTSCRFVYNGYIWHILWVQSMIKTRFCLWSCCTICHDKLDRVLLIAYFESLIRDICQISVKIQIITLNLFMALYFLKWPTRFHEYESLHFHGYCKSSYPTWSEKYAFSLNDGFYTLCWCISKINCFKQ